MNNFEIRKMQTSDLPRAMEVYGIARQFMADHGNPRQWGNTNWPPVALIEDDIASGRGFVCLHEGKIVGVFFYDQGEAIEPCYNDIEEGQWKDDSPYGVVHRVASDGSVKGIGSYCINWAIDKAGHLRMDTHPDNTVMQSLLTKLGFERCGVIHVEEDNDPRYAYEIVR